MAYFEYEFKLYILCIIFLLYHEILLSYMLANYDGVEFSRPIKDTREIFKNDSLRIMVQISFVLGYVTDLCYYSFWRVKYDNTK